MSFSSGPWFAMIVPRPNRSELRLTAITKRAPRARAAETGTGLTRAPSTSQRPPISTGGKIPGSEYDARNALLRRPRVSQIS